MASYRLRGNSNLTLVFLDTNAIFTVFEFSIDLEDELTRLLGSFIIKIPESVIHEIESISNKGKGKQKMLAKAAINFIKKYPVLSHSSFDNADDALLHLATNFEAVVVTNDKALRDRLKDNNVPRVFLRGKQHLVFEK